MQSKVALVVDDHLLNRYVLAEALLSLGHRTTEARDGVEAVSLASVSKFDCIFMDLEMPRKSGVEAIAEIRALPEYKDTPIIANTASDSDLLVEQALQAGATECLIKPFDVEQVLARYFK